MWVCEREGSNRGVGVSTLWTLLPGVLVVIW